LYDTSKNALLTAHVHNDLYIFKPSQYHALSANSAAPLAELTDWHQQLGHLNVQSVMRLFRAGRIDGLDAINAADLSKFQCEACVLGKGKRLPSPTAPLETRSTKLLELLHVDLWGPASLGGKKYFLTCYDDYSHHVDLYFLKNKWDALAALKNHTAKAELQTGCRIKQIRADGGGEFTSNAAKAFYLEKGWEHLLVPPGAQKRKG
jgi:hypothetical protein